MPFLKIENLTNSPFDLEGGIILPAFGKVEADFTPEYAALLDHSLALKVETKLAPVGKQGPEIYNPGPVEKPADEPDIETIREEAASLDIKVDGRWSAHRLQQEIDKALKGA